MTYHHTHRGVYGLAVNQGAVLVIRKARGPYTGMFDLPGGSPEEGETPEQTLARELQEETGCTATQATLLGTTTLTYKYNKDGTPAQLDHTGTIFACTLQGTPKQGGDGEDSHGCIWLPLADITPTTATPFVYWACYKQGLLPC